MTPAALPVIVLSMKKTTLAAADATFRKLVADLVEGAACARVAAEECGDDDGACNFDAPMLSFDRSPTASVRRAYEAACHAADLSCFWADAAFGAGKNRRLVIGPGAGGQGYSRTRAAEAFARHLQISGWETASVYYQAD